MITLNVAKQGESITFFAAADSAAPSVELQIRMAPGASGPPAHRHTKQREIFRVVSGQIVATVDGRQQTAGAGEVLVVEPGQAHTFVNGSATEPLVFRGVVEPALHFQWFLTEMAGAAIRGGGSWKDLPVLEAAYILYNVRDEYRVAGLPAIAQDIIFGTLARLAVLLGRTKHIAPKPAAGVVPAASTPEPA